MRIKWDTSKHGPYPVSITRPNDRIVDHLREELDGGITYIAILLSGTESSATIKISDTEMRLIEQKMQLIEQQKRQIEEQKELEYQESKSKLESMGLTAEDIKRIVNR